MIAIIAAVAENRVIGNKGKIPWDIPEDMAHFKSLTMGNILVMGRHTYEEIGRPLPGRMTYLVSSKLQVEEKNCHTVSTLQEAIELAGTRDSFICGGARLYQEALPIAEYLYLTEIARKVSGDAFFPEVPQDDFVEVQRKTLCDDVQTVKYKRK